MRIDTAPPYALDLIRPEHYEGNLLSNLLLDRLCCVATIDAHVGHVRSSNRSFSLVLEGCEMTAPTWLGGETVA